MTQACAGRERRLVQDETDGIEAEQTEDGDIGDRERERDEEDQRCLVDLRDGL